MNVTFGCRQTRVSQHLKSPPLSLLFWISSCRRMICRCWKSKPCSGLLSGSQLFHHWGTPNKKPFLGGWSAHPRSYVTVMAVCASNEEVSI